MVKVLILHQFYNTPDTGGALRSYFLAKALVEHGIEAAVITTHNERGIKITNDEGIELHYLPIIYNNRFGFFKRVFSFLRFVFSIVKEAGHFKDSTLCYAISAPLTTGLAAIWIKWRYKIPFYFEVGDLWPEAPVQLGIVKNPVLKFLLYGLEKRIYKETQLIVALSAPIRNAIERKVPGKQIVEISNMADTNFFGPESKDPALEKKFQVEGKFVISFMGTLGFANGLDYLVRCAESCTKENLPVHFLLCGDGAEKDKLVAVAKNLNLTNISFLPFQNREGVKEVMDLSDAVFVCFKPISILETGSPNKFFDGLAAGKLIIINFGGWIREEIEKHKCGVFVNPQDASQFTQKIKPYIEERNRLQEAQKNSRALAETKYSRKLLTAQFVDLFR